MGNSVVQMVHRYKLIAIIRGIDPSKGLELAKALYEGGVRLMEVTFDQKDTEKHKDTVALIAAIKNFFGDSVRVGAGTVTTPELVCMAKDAGAEYIISPDCKEAVIRKTKELGLISMPGALTPTEVTNAHDWGADFVKLFPVGCMGTAYIKAVRAPLNHVDLLAVGGVNDSNMIDYLDAGCCGVGMGGSLVNRKWIDAGEFDKITTYTKCVVEKIEKWGNDR